jgi:hypothetical protein
MGDFSTRQVVLLVVALLIAGALTAWGTTYVLERFVLGDPSDPLTKQGGLSPDQAIGIGKK